MHTVTLQTLSLIWRMEISKVTQSQMKTDLEVCNEIDPIGLVLPSNVPTKPGPSYVEQQDLL